MLTVDNCLTSHEPYFIIIAAFTALYIFSPNNFVFVFTGLGMGVIVAIYVFVVGIRIRYLGFLFLDEYDPTTFSYGALFAKMRELNRIKTKDAITQIFVFDALATSLDAAVNTVVRVISTRLAQSGQTGEVAGNMLQTTSSLSLSFIQSFARAIVTYSLYQYARASVYGNSQKTNEYVYSLAD